MKKTVLCYASLLLCAGALLTGCGSNATKTAQTDAEGFQLIFDGETLDGWDYDSVYWRVENGVMVGEVTPETLLKRNTFIIKKDLVLTDFELKVEYRVSDRGNSGISYRNARIDTLAHALTGYQADLDGANHYTGQNYEERGRQFLAVRGQTVVIEPGHTSPTSAQVRAMGIQQDSLGQFVKAGDWNEYHIIAKGNHLLHYVNGVLMSDVTDNDPQYRRLSGLLGVQVHTGPPMKVEYRNFRIKPLE